MTIRTAAREDMLKQIGARYQPGEGGCLDQARINAFVDCTEDHQFIHVDEEVAAQPPFGGTIAHGFLTLSLQAKMTESVGAVPENVVMGGNYGFDRIRFLAPLHAHVEVLDVTAKDDKRFLIQQGVSVEI